MSSARRLLTTSSAPTRTFWLCLSKNSGPANCCSCKPPLLCGFLLAWGVSARGEGAFSCHEACPRAVSRDPAVWPCRDHPGLELGPDLLAVHGSEFIPDRSASRLQLYAIRLGVAGLQVLQLLREPQHGL